MARSFISPAERVVRAIDQRELYGTRAARSLRIVYHNVSVPSRSPLGQGETYSARRYRPAAIAARQDRDVLFSVSCPGK